MKGFHARTPLRTGLSANIESQSPFVPHYSLSLIPGRVALSLSIYTFALDHLNFQPAEREKLATYFLKALCPPLKHAPPIEISDRNVSESRLDRILFRELHAGEEKKTKTRESFARLADEKGKWENANLSCWREKLRKLMVIIVYACMLSID